MDEASKAGVLSLVRSILIAVGGYLVAHGLADDKTVKEAVGLFMVIAPLVWGLCDKFAAERRTRVREHVALNAGIVHADSIVGLTPVVAPEEARALIAATPPTVAT